MSEKRLAGRVAIVTGATKGIGLEIAKRLGEAGARVAINGRSSSETELVKKALGVLNNSGIESKYYVCDVSSSAAVKGMVEAVLKDFSKVDLLTSKIPIGRLGKVEEVADLVYFLVASEAANFITGQAMDLSGGRADY